MVKDKTDLLWQGVPGHGCNDGAVNHHVLSPPQHLVSANRRGCSDRLRCSCQLAARSMSVYAKLLKSAFRTSKAGIVDRGNMIAMIDNSR